ncbi:MAG TPA: transposase [Ktedonobacterales bacterium]|nr:transposase [Ktedonobacterales bacterium]
MNGTSCHKTYKEKLRPTPTQERELERVLWQCRELYHAALEQRITAWQRHHVSVSRYEQEAELKDIRAAFPEYAVIHSHVLQDVLARLDKAYQAFFRQLERGEQAGFPRYKGPTRYHSFTFKEYGNGARLDNGFLVLSKIGRIRMYWSRHIEGSLKTVTVAKEADGWYVSISCAEVPTHPLLPAGQETAIDLGLESFATLADGTMLHNPRCYRRAEAYLRRCQRRVARRTKGGSRRRKAVQLLAKAHQKIRRQRRDFHRKTALVLVLVRQYDTIYYEDLRVRNMVQNHSLAKSISDAGWSAFLTILASKAAGAGKRMHAVNPAFTSQVCSGPDCGHVVWEGLSVRWHACPECGTNLHRNHNAARNILRQGQEKQAK